MKKLFVFILFIIVGVWGWNTYGDGLQMPDWRSHEDDVLTTNENVHIPKIDVTGQVALLIDEGDKSVLYDKNAMKRIYPASTTKIVTALVALKYGDLEENITVGREVEKEVKGESTAFLMQGRTYTLRELLNGLMLPSGNDAARSIAVHIGKVIAGDDDLSNEQATEVFVDEMNRYVKRLGATNSHFVNSNGLHDNNHYTTAKDMAIITLAAMKKKAFMEVVSQNTYQDNQVTFKNTNQLLDPENEHYFQGVDGIKTGYTDEAGRCLVSSIKVNGRHLVALIYDSTDEAIFTDAIALLNAGIHYVD